MIEKEVQALLFSHCLIEKNHAAAVPNSTQLLYWEADMLSVTRSGLVHEYEIKCSRKDYMAEFRNKSRKHWRLKNIRANKDPNYFWFVTNGFGVNEVPEYAGHMVVAEYQNGLLPRLVLMKDAPRLHGGKWNNKQVAKIARLLSFRLLKEYESVPVKG